MTRAKILVAAGTLRATSLLMLMVWAAWSASCWATAIQMVYQDKEREERTGAFDDTPIAPLPDNPGKTLGEQRRFTHEYVLKLAERVFWFPDSRTIHAKVSWKQLTGACAQAYSGFFRKEPGDRIGTSNLLYKLEVSPPRRFSEGGSEFEIAYSDKRVSLSLDPSQGGQVVSGLHEVIHLLGFASLMGQSVSELLTPYDTHIRLPGNLTAPQDMTKAEVRERFVDVESGTELRWLGTRTAEMAPILLNAGEVDGQVLLDTTVRGAHRQHVARSLRPYSIMGPGGAATLELGIVAYMLSDLGWGPVVDSEVMPLIASKDSPTSTTVTVDAMVRARVEDGNASTADNVVVTATLPESPDGLRVGDVFSSPLTCPKVATNRKVSCEPATLSDSASIQYVFTGEPGLYEVEVDVDHRAPHVDPRPVNNFATVHVTVGVNSIDEVTLSAASIAEGRVAGTEVGTLDARGVAGFEDQKHTFALADGGRHNACFRLEGDDGEQLVTAKPFDREGAASLEILVRARAENGFTLERDFTVEVTPAAVASGWTWSVAAYADAGSAALSLRNLALAALLLFVAGYALRSSPSRGRGGRIALALAVLLLVASCGGDGGSSSSAPPAPPPVPFAC